MKKNIYTAVLLLLVITLSACGTTSNTSTGETNSPKKTETKASAAPATVLPSETNSPKKIESKASTAPAGQWEKVDKSLTVEGVQYTINAYKKSKKASIYTAKTGNVFLLVDITVKNNNKEEAPLSSVLMFELTDAEKKEYNISLGGFAALEQEKIEQLDGSVAASSEKRCGLAYEVPENAKGVKLSIKELLGEGKQTVDLY